MLFSSYTSGRCIARIPAAACINWIANKLVKLRDVTDLQPSIPETLWRLARVLGAGNLARSLASHWPYPVRVSVVGGHEMYVDLRSSIGRGLFATGTFDMAAIQPALNALCSGAVMIDVGANIGFYSLLASHRVGPTGRIISFEMDPRPLTCFRKTISGAKIRNIHVEEAAVSDIDGIIRFKPAAEHGHNKIERFRDVGKSVRSVRLDTWVQQAALSRVDVLKIDVEGAEQFVLEGAVGTIARFKPLILCEASDQTKAFGYKPKDLVSFFTGIDYKAEWLEGVWTPTLFAKPGHSGKDSDSW